MAGKHTKKTFEKCGKSVFDLGVMPKKTVSAPKALKVIVIITAAAITVSSAFVGNYFWQGYKNQKLLNATVALFQSQGVKAFDTLADKNSDIKARLEIPNTQINHIVCHTDNNSFYINHNQYKQKSRFGALFLSSSDDFSRNGDDKNIVIMGNNMYDGSMFGVLKKYKNINFYKENANIKLHLKNGNSENYIVFAVMVISLNESESSYKPFQSHFKDGDEFKTWLNETNQRSIIKSNIGIKYNDEFLTLMTESDDFEGAQLAVMAKKVDEWTLSHTDLSDSSINPDTKYPNAWYTERGLEIPKN